MDEGSKPEEVMIGGKKVVVVERRYPKPTDEQLRKCNFEDVPEPRVSKHYKVVGPFTMYIPKPGATTYKGFPPGRTSNQHPESEKARVAGDKLMWQKLVESGENEVVDTPGSSEVKVIVSSCWDVVESTPCAAASVAASGYN